MLRKKVATKARKIIRAQEKGSPIPKITDEGPTGGGEPTPKAPITPGAPAEPAVDKGELEDEVKKEIKDEEKEEATLDTIKEVLETIVDALEDQKDVLEKSLLGKTEDEGDFEEFKDEDNMENEEEFTPEEFGINPEELIVSREENMTANKRRKARKARLYKNAKSARTLSEEFELDKAKKKTFKPVAPAPSITKVKSDEIPVMFKMAELALELNDAKNKWTVLHTAADGVEKPIYEINKTNEENFETEDFGNGIFETMKEKGVEPALAAYGAETITNLTKKEEVRPIEDEEEKKTLNDYKRQFNRAFRLAVSAMDKNLVQNPLKGAFYEILTDTIDLDPKVAMHVIDSAFSKSAIDHIETALAETDKYLEMSDEALIETESAIGELRTKNLEVSSEDVDVTPQFSDRAEAMRKRATKANLPISTDSASDPTDRVEALFNALPKPKLAGISRL